MKIWRVVAFLLALETVAYVFLHYYMELNFPSSTRAERLALENSQRTLLIGFMCVSAATAAIGVICQLWVRSRK
jgi:hypothetical protein